MKILNEKTNEYLSGVEKEIEYYSNVLKKYYENDCKDLFNFEYYKHEVIGLMNSFGGFVRCFDYQKPITRKCEDYSDANDRVHTLFDKVTVLFVDYINFGKESEN